MFNKSEQKSQKDTNRKNRKYSILLLALLFIGVATYGTYAYFTDSKSVDGQLALTKGQVSLGDVDNQVWTYMGNTGSSDDYASLKTGDKQLSLKNKNISAQTGTSFSNVLPGDTFTTTIDIKYTGSVDAEGSVKVKNVPKDVNYNISVAGKSLASANGSKDISFKGDSDDNDKSRIVKIVLTVQVPYKDAENFVESSGKSSRNNGKGKNFLEQFKDAITVTVNQKLTPTTSSN